MKSALALFLLAATAAWAQTDATTPPKQEYAYFSTCLKYPPDALAAHAQGTAEVSLSVAADGHVSNAVLTKSSGNAALDKRTLACIEVSRYRPATRNAVPVDVVWHETITWSIDEWQGNPYGRVHFAGPSTSVNGIQSPESIGKPHICSEYYPPINVRLGVQGTTTVGFTITTQGTTENVHVVNSAGDKLLDDAAVFCASQWLYRPALKDSQPIAVPWKAEVRWFLK
jgi:TonB family protein